MNLHPGEPISMCDDLTDHIQAPEVEGGVCRSGRQDVASCSGHRWEWVKGQMASLEKVKLNIHLISNMFSRWSAKEEAPSALQTLQSRHAGLLGLQRLHYWDACRSKGEYLFSCFVWNEKPLLFTSPIQKKTERKCLKTLSVYSRWDQMSCAQRNFSILLCRDENQVLNRQLLLCHRSHECLRRPPSIV